MTSWDPFEPYGFLWCL